MFQKAHVHINDKIVKIIYTLILFILTFLWRGCPSQIFLDFFAEIQFFVLIDDIWFVPFLSLAANPYDLVKRKVGGSLSHLTRVGNLSRIIELR